MCIIGKGGINGKAGEEISKPIWAGAPGDGPGSFYSPEWRGYTWCEWLWSEIFTMSRQAHHFTRSVNKGSWNIADPEEKKKAFSSRCIAHHSRLGLLGSEDTG